MYDEYISYFSIELASSLILLLLLIFTPGFRKRKTVESKRIVHIAVLAMICPVLNVLSTVYMDFFLNPLAQEELTVWHLLVHRLLIVLRELLCLQIVLGWNLFVDYGFNKSYDHVNKKRKKVLLWGIPLSVIFVLIRAWQHTLTDGGTMRLWIFGSIGDLSYLIQTLLVINAIWIVWVARKRRKPPTFLRLDLFLIPTAAGYFLWYIVNYLPPFIRSDYRNVGISVAVLLTWIALLKRDQYMDPVTGFYNRKFLSTMNRYMEKNGYPNSIGVYFSAPGSEGKLIPILDSLKPADAEFFSFGKDEYLLLSGPQKESVIRLLIRSVNLKAEQEGCDFTVQTAYAIRGKDETPEAFTKRLSEKEFNR